MKIASSRTRPDMFFGVKTWGEVEREREVTYVALQLRTMPGPRLVDIAFSLSTLVN